MAEWKSWKKCIRFQSPNTILLLPCSELEVFSLLKSLRKNTAAGTDELKTEPILTVSDVLSGPICHTCNHCAMTTGFFPDSMKIARLVV